MKYGILTEGQSQEGVAFIVGEISTYSMRLKITLVSNPDCQDNDKLPTHNIWATAKHGGQFHAGVAWLGTTLKGDPMYSMAIAVPELFDGELRLMAWSEGGGQYRIEESKPQKEAA